MTAGVVASHYVASGAPLAYSAEVLADSPLAYYRQGEASGTTMVDSSGNSRDGTYSATGVTFGATSLLTSDANKATSWPGGSGTLGWVTSAAWQGPSSFTVEARIKPASVSGIPTILSRYNSSFSTSHFAFRQDANKLSLYLFVGSGLAVATGSTTLVVGTTYTVAGTYDGTTIKVYVNGAIDGSASSSAPNASQTVNLSVGARNTDFASANAGRDCYNGVLDEVSYTGTALSAARLLVRHTAAIT